MAREGYKKNGKFYVYCEDHYEEVNEAVYRTIMDEVWREQKRKQRNKRCRGEKGNRCNGDCENCEKSRLGKGMDGSPLSLDQLFEENGYEYKGSDGHADVVVLKMTLAALIEELREMVPDADRIVDMIRDEEQEKDVAEELGVPKTTLNYRKNKVADFLREHLKDFI